MPRNLRRSRRGGAKTSNYHVDDIVEVGLSTSFCRRHESDTAKSMFGVVVFRISNIPF